MSGGPDLPEVFGAAAAPRSTLSDAVARGELRRLARGLYTRDLTAAPEEVIRRNLYDVVAALYPSALISDRSARLGARPADDGSLFLVHPRSSDAVLPGVTLRPRNGPAAIETDLSLPAGLHMSSVPRALLENAALSRGRRGRVPRTLTRPELEEWLESLVDQRGEDGFRVLREDVRTLAARLGLEEELRVLDPLMGTVLGTRSDVRAHSPRLRARQKGHPYDDRRVELFDVLAQTLDRLALPVLPVTDSSAARLKYLPFFEAYFSNFIEGTEFAVEEASEIVFHHVIPPARPADAHDILGTYQIVSDTHEMSRAPTDADELVELLRSRHRVLLHGRPAKRPGEFKLKPNRVGGVDFVTPTRVEGTLRRGFDYYRQLIHPFARAVFQMFLVSEVHPFDDGNGRIGRVMMNAELVAASEHRILIPQVYRNNYVMALRALTSNARADALIATLAFAQRYTAAIDFSSLDAAQAMLTETNAFRDPTEADATGVRLTLPEARALGSRWQVVAGPREYTRGPGGVDIDIGWAWDIERDGQRQTVRVEVAGGRLGTQDLSGEARQAIATKGRSAVEPLLLHAQPPGRVLITSDGIFTQ